MKLFTQEEIKEAPNLPLPENDEDYMSSEEIDTALESLSDHTDAYISMSTVHSSMTTEGFSLVDKNNYILFNEYLSTIKRNLNVDTTAHIATETVVETPHLLKHHHLALEGIISSIWDKIKSMFSKIGSAMKEFFKRHFTRLGRIKKRLENIIKTLEKSDKDLQKMAPDKIPSKIKTVFPVNGVVSEATLENAMRDAELIKVAIRTVNEEGKKVARVNVLDRKILSDIKNFKDNAASLREESINPFGKKRSQARADTKVADAMQSSINDEVESNRTVVDAEEDDVGLEEAKKEMEDFYKKIEPHLQKLVDRPLPGKTKISEIKIDPESGIQIETEKNDDEPNDVTLGSKSSLLGVNRKTLEIITDLEKGADSYDGVNKEINKTIGDVDKIINDLSRMEDKSNDGYRKVLEKKVKPRLKLLQSFFKNYNSINKNLLTYVTDFGEGVVAYTTTSMKYFG